MEFIEPGSDSAYERNLIRVNSSGDMLWTTAVPGQWEGETYVKSTISLDDCGFVAAGDLEGGSWDIFLMRISDIACCCNGNVGDVNNDGDDANILDLTFLVDFIFRGSGDPGPCPEESDVNGDGEVANILDLTFLVDIIFRGGPVPPACP